MKASEREKTACVQEDLFRRIINEEKDIGNRKPGGSRSSCGRRRIWAVVGRGDGNTSDNVVYVNSVENIMNPGSGNGAINRFAGVVETQQKLEIQVEQDKTVKEVFVEEGQTVEVGTPLFEYDTEKTEEELSKAKLELERISNTIGNKYNEIAALEKEKNSADQEAKLDYTMQIQSAQMELKQSEYEKKSKQVEIQKLQDTLENAQVESEMAGVVKSINDGSSGEMNYNGESQAFMTIIAMGDFGIKGKINEQNMGAIDFWTAGDDSFPGG